MRNLFIRLYLMSTYIPYFRNAVADKELTTRIVYKYVTELK